MFCPSRPNLVSLACTGYRKDKLWRAHMHTQTQATTIHTSILYIWLFYMTTTKLTSRDMSGGFLIQFIALNSHTIWLSLYWCGNIGILIRFMLFNYAHISGLLSHFQCSVGIIYFFLTMLSYVLYMKFHGINIKHPSCMVVGLCG